MPLFRQSNAPSRRVKVIKAVNGGSRGHEQWYDRSSFWDAVGEREFEDQVVSSRSVAMKKRQNSHDTQRTKQLSASSAPFGGSERDFWGRSENEEEDFIFVPQTAPLPYQRARQSAQQVVIEELPLTPPKKTKKSVLGQLKKKLFAPL